MSTLPFVFSIAGLVVSLFALGAGLVVWSKLASFEPARIDVRCDTRNRETLDRVAQAERAIDRIADEVAADLSDAKKERARAQAQNARNAKVGAAQVPDGPTPDWTNEQLSAWATNKGLI